MLADSTVRRFHKAVGPGMLATGLLRLFSLKIDGQTIGTYYGFAHRRHAYGYLNGFDPKFGFDSPGTTLLGHAMRDAIASRCECFHFLRGQEAYKYSWGASDRWNSFRTLRLSDPGASKERSA